MILAVSLFILHCFLLFSVAFKFYLTTQAPKRTTRFQKEHVLPKYSILVPAYKESAILNKLLDSMNKLDYPKDKLEIFVILEEDDHEAIELIQRTKLPSYMQVVVVAPSLPKTKPKACNEVLRLCTGEFVVVYDAEDRPAPDQLKLAVNHFRAYGDDTVCLQANLNWFNAHENTLTKLFSLEYSVWFTLFVPALCALGYPVPLGGTSNHFRLKALKELGGWDAYNVTEDAELGLRLHIQGYKVRHLDSETLEECVVDPVSWIKQRTRWLKGHLQTWIKYGFSCSHKRILDNVAAFLFVLGSPVCSLLTLPLNITFIVTLFSPSVAHYLFPSFVFQLAAFLCMTVGNLMVMYAYVVARQKKVSSIYILLLPFYFILHSIAAVRASIQMFTNPHLWEKTTHGKTKID